MHKTFILVTQEAEKLGAKHRPIFFETPCIDQRAIPQILPLTSKNFGTEKKFGPKLNVGPKKIFVLKKFWLKKILVQNKIWSQTKYWSQKKLQ